VSRHRTSVIPVMTLSVALSLAGCLVGPDYQAPEVKAPEQFRHEPAKPLADPTSLADLPWWEIFKDDELQKLIRVALEENKDLQLAAVRVDEARAELGITKSQLLPTVSAGANATLTEIPGANIPGIPAGTSLRTPLYSTELTMTWELDIWGRLRRATEAAKAQLMATDEVRKAVVMGLISRVAQAYFELRGLDLELEISRRTLASREASLKLVKMRHDGGVSSALDLRKAEAEAVSTASSIPDLERQIAQKENALSILLGRNPGAVPRGLAVTQQPLPPTVPSGLPSALLERRPDLREAEQALVGANAQIGVAKAAFFPQVSLTGQYGYMSRDLSNLFVGPNRMWGIGPGVTLPIFNAGRNQAQLEGAEAKQKEALIKYQQAVQEAFRDVDDALIAYQKVRETRLYQEQLIDAAQKALALAELRYKNGVSSYLDVLDAQRQLFNAEIGLAQTRRGQLVAVVLLYRALGGGWSDTQPAKSPEPAAPATVPASAQPAGS
jgi:multidrug efflux system outer membrane protein